MLKVINTEGITQDSIIYKLTTIIYDLYQLPVVCDIVNYPLEVEDHCLLIKKQLTPHFFEYFLTLKINQKIDEKQQKAIEKLLSLSDKIICFQLNHQIQSRIEKQYISLIPELYAKYSQKKLWIKKPSISFIHESYRKFYSRKAEGIFYYKNSDQYLASFLKKQEKSKEEIRESQPFISSLKTIGEFEQVQKKDLFPGLTVAQFFNIYNDEAVSEKQACQLKYSIINFKQSEQDEKKKQKSVNYLFEEGFNDLNRKVLREIQKYEKDKQFLKRLESKYGRMRNFSDLVYQESNNRGLVKKYKNCSVFDLHQDIIFLEVKEFYRFWARNTLKILKSYFKAIANRRDIKTINQFRSKCFSCMEIINKSMQTYDRNTENFILVEKMRKELQQFISIHEKVIRNQYPSIIKYFPYQIKYFWQNEPKIYYKCGLVVLILLFAYLQGNILLGASLFSIVIILMIINI